ncbi:hypothetical protein BCAR13_350054 [Paraburkholderia caribensis]|nr:hypothetical protein BCAR13_350054 [Paraburkholderia caribensis]
MGALLSSLRIRIVKWLDKRQHSVPASKVSVTRCRNHVRATCHFCAWWRAPRFARAGQ